MTTYRVTRRTPLSTGQTEGDLVDSSQFKKPVLDGLIKSGALSPVAMPPLAELPGWSTRAARLAPLGVVTMEDLLEASPETVKAIKAEFKFKTIAPLQKWQEEALEWIKPTKPIQPKRR